MATRQKFDKEFQAENFRLLRAYQAGDEEALGQLMKRNAPLVLAVTKEFWYRGLDLEDLIQFGNIGMLSAARRFKFERKCCFSTFARPRIWGKIFEGVQQDSRLIHVPCYKQNRWNKVWRAIQQFAPLPYDPEIVAQKCGTTVEDVLHAVEMQRDPVVPILVPVLYPYRQEDRRSPEEMAIFKQEARMFEEGR